MMGAMLAQMMAILSACRMGLVLGELLPARVGSFDGLHVGKDAGRRFD